MAPLLNKLGAMVPLLFWLCPGLRFRAALTVGTIGCRLLPDTYHTIGCLPPHLFQWDVCSVDVSGANLLLLAFFWCKRKRLWLAVLSSLNTGATHWPTSPPISKLRHSHLLANNHCNT